MSNQTNEIWEGLYWENNTILIGYSGWLVILILIIIRLKPKLLEFKDSKCLKLLKCFEKLILKILKFLDNCCTLMVDDIDTIYLTITFKEEPKQTKDLIGHWFNWGKPNKDVKVEPIKKKIEKAKEEKPKENKHPLDIAQEIITEQNKVSLAVKWSAIPLEVLFDEQFLTILNVVGELTDVSPLQDALTQLPKSIYEIVKQYEHMPVYQPNLLMTLFTIFPKPIFTL